MLCLVALFYSMHSQDLSPEKLGFDHFEIEDKALGTINYYVSKNENKKPILIYLDGSGPYPLFHQMDGGFIGSTVVLDFDKLSKNYSVVLISKPGVPFVDKMESDSTGFPKYEEPEEYVRKLSLNWRVDSASKVIDELVKNRNGEPADVIVFGFSEGAQVGPYLAEKNKNVTHLLLFGGNGLNQLFDPIITARMKASTGQISETEAQQEIDSLFVQYKQIYNKPESINDHWWGHSYKRWASFAQKDPYKSLVNLDIPIYMANGSMDENSVLSADYIQLEFIKKQKSNLTYKTYPNYDHQFFELIFENNEFKEAIPRLDLVMKDAFDWLGKR